MKADESKELRTSERANFDVVYCPECMTLHKKPKAKE